MSKPTKEEMLELLNEWHQSCQVPDCATMCSEELFLICEQTYKAIRRLIEQKPKVTKEFVERWATFWQDDFSGFTLDHIKDHIEAMFAEIKGIEIEEENE